MKQNDMRTNSLNNSFSLLNYKNLNSIGRYVATIAAILFLAIPQAWGAITYKTKLSATAGTGGSVKLSNSSTVPDTYDGSPIEVNASGAGETNTYYAWALPSPGYVYVWKSWTAKNSSKTGASITIETPKITIETPKNASVQAVICAAPTSNADANCDDKGGFNLGWLGDGRYATLEYSISASFAPITLEAPENVTITNLTNPLSTYEKYTGTLTFTASHPVTKEDISDVTYKTNSGHGTLTLSEPSFSDNSITVSYTFKGSDTYGGSDNDRNNSFTVTLTTAANQTADCDVSVSFIDPTVTSAGTTEEVRPTSPTAVADGSATFNVKYADDANDFTASFSDAMGGTWTLGTLSFKSTEAATGTGVITVPFTFCANGASDDFSATLTLTPVGSGEAKTITVYAGFGKNYDVEVYDASGMKISDDSKATWAYGLDLANKNAGSTIKLMRNIDLGELSASQEIKDNITLDLNGKTLSASLKANNAATYQRMFWLNTAAKTFTIMDSKTGGTIDVSANYANAKYAIYVAKGNVVLNSGKVQIKNTTTGNSNVTYATGVYVAAGTTFTMNGGEIFASHPAYRRADGVLGAGSPTVPSTITINGGKIIVESGTHAYGVSSTGIVNVHNVAEINANTLTGAYAYGLYMGAYSNATEASCYSSTLTMTGGTINATTKTSNAYGIYTEASQTASASATDGTLTNKSAAVLNITGGTINSTTTTTTAYGIYVMGRYNSLTKTYSISQIKNATVNAIGKRGTAYGVYSAASTAAANGGLLLGDVELTDVTVNAITESVTADGKTTNYNTAYCLYVQATQTTGTGANNTGVEYAAGAKMTVNSGTYTATTTGTDAYSAVTGQRSITFNEGAEGLPELIIHGGKFVANAGTSRARAVSTGGYTTIDGGEFHSTAGTSTAYGLYAITGKLTANGVKVTATAQNSTAYGAYLEASVTNYDGIKAGVLNHGEMVLNNLDVTATTVTGNDARGVSVYTASRTLTQAQFDALSDANKTKYDKTFVMQDGVTRGGQWACAGKLTVNGGTYNVTSAGITAYGACLNTTTVTANMTNASGEMTLKNATFNVQTNNANAVSNNRTNTYGVNAGGKTTIDGCTFNITGAHTNTYGVWATNKKTTIGNSKITTSGKVSVYGIYGTVDINSTNGYTTYADIELNEGNNITTTATAGNSAYALYLSATKKAIVSGDFAGDYAIAATAIVNGGKYTATASGTTAYAACVADPVLQGEATATPTLIINGGKFKGTAGAAPFADVSVNGEPGYFVLNGGYYVKDENLDKKLGEGMNKVAVNSGTPEYTEGYRWRITDNMTGEYVCKIKENGISYASLEEALQVVNADPNSTWTIIMIANYTLSKGDYVLPANTTLLIPYKSDQTTINGPTPTYTSPAANVEQYEAPSPLYKLTFANGVNMSVYGKMEASAVTYLSNQGLLTRGTGVVSGKYGWLYLNEGSHIDLENGSALYAWGYVTGKGEINAKNGSSVYEDFQMGDWRGGTEESKVQGNTNGLDNKGVFLITHYYYQNIECPITYRAGAQGFAHGGTYMYQKNFLFTVDEKVPTKEAVKMIGTSDAMFLMDTATAGEDTWVRKEYDAETDYVNWTMNSGAKLGSVSLKMTLPILGDIDLSSSDYVLPITSNFNIIANDGEIQITNHVCFIPGSKLTIKKEGTLTIPYPQRVFFYDQDNWNSYGGFWFYPGYSPSWKKNPRLVLGSNSSVKMPDAEVLVEGTLDIRGAAYTTAGGANIHSTRENAGQVKFTAAAPASTSAVASNQNKNQSSTLFQMIGGGPDYEGKALTSAKLKNEDGEYTLTTGTAAGDIYAYMEDPADGVFRWLSVRDNGCFTKIKGASTKEYIHPSDWVAVQANTNGDHAYHSEVGTRMFVNTEAPDTLSSCVWWEVDPTPKTIGDTKYYIANNENFDNYGTYFYWDNETSYWKPKKITVTWKNYDGSKLDNGTYGDEYNFNTSPQFYGTNPTKTNTTVEKYDWIGWRDEEGNIYDKNATLPRAKSNVTYTAYFNTTKYQYTITFKNDDNSDLWAGLVDAGTTGAELQALFKQKYNEKTGNTVPQKAPTVDKVFFFDKWYPALATVKAAATYVAQYSESLRQYHVIFYNYDAVSVLYEADVDYNANPVYGGVTPFRANTSAFSYDWTGWKQGATTYGTSDKLPKVMGDISYIATFDTTALKYQVFFKRQDGSIIDAPFFTYGEIPSAFPANPTMASTVSTDYTFREWSPATLEPVTEDGKVYTALFDESPRQYTAHFVNYNGVSLNKDQTIDYNKVPEYTGATPFKPNDARNSYVFSGWAWAAGDGWEAGSIAAGEAFPAIEGNITFTAQFTPTLLQLDAGFYVDIVDVQNANASSGTLGTLTINTNGWASSGWPYTVNEVVYEKGNRKADRTLIIPYTGEVGATFAITVTNKNSVIVSKHNYIIPAEITSSVNLADQQILYVKSGATLTVNADKTVKNIYVAPGAKMVVNNGITLTADTVFLRTTPWASAELDLNGTITGQVCYTRIISKKDQYYQFALPMPCPIADVRLSDGSMPVYGNGWLLRSYSEQHRAQHGSGADIDNWVTLTNEGEDVNKTIRGCVGYEMFSNSGYYREYYFPVAHTGLSDRVAVTRTTDATVGAAQEGWNIIVSPLMRAYTQSPAPEGMTVSWLQQDGSYWQLPVEEIKPAIPFSYQATETGYITFGENIGLSALAPRRVTASEEQVRIQWLQLDVEAADGKTDQTSIYSHPTRYEQTYKTGIDVEKQSLSASRALLYSSHAYGEMACAGVADELLEQGVALTVYSPKAQELTISMRENEWLNRMAFVWLIDKATGAQIDLLESDYSFSAEAGTTAGRFILMGAFFAPQITTDNGTVQGDDEDIKAKKFIYKDKMYIQINGVIYDATGKLVK